MAQTVNRIQAKIVDDFQQFRGAFKSKESLVKYFETKADSSGDPYAVRNKWKNEDLDISPPKDHTWTWYDYGSFWWTYGFTPGTWYVGASLLAVGLTSWQALICIFVGYLFGAIGMVLHSRSAAVYHFGFPVESRIPWGLRGAYFPVLIRAMTALIWTGVSIATGGYHMTLVLRCIFGSSFWDLPNHIPASSGIDVQNLIGVILYWVLTAWILNIPIPVFRRWFEIKAFLLPPATIGLFIWCMLKGRGAPHKDMYQLESLHGSQLAWAMVSGINAIMGKTSTLVVNQPDIARYARTKSAPVWSQLIFLPLGNTGCAALGIFATERIYNVWGNLDWNPWDLNHDMLDHNWSAGNRTGICVLNLLFLFANAVTDQGANVIPFGADFMTLFPRWLNIKRGMWIAYILGVCICPWHILSSAFGFLQFLGGYSIFLGPFLGTFVTDYFMVRKGNVYVKDLYEPTGRYWYFHGIGWRPAVTWILSVAFVVPGFTATFGHQLAGGIGWTRLYDVSWFYVCTISSIIYFGLSHIGDYAKEERNMPFEALANIIVIEGQEESSDLSEVNIPVVEKV